jgi:hypothetical protein
MRRAAINDKTHIAVHDFISWLIYVLIKRSELSMMVQIMHSSNPSQMEATKMAQADSSLSPFRPISQSAVHVLALMAAKKVVREQMRDEGRRVTLIPPAEINVKARAYLDQHPEFLRRQRSAQG